jgi:hypothetical protein
MPSGMAWAAGAATAATARPRATVLILILNQSLRLIAVPSFVLVVMHRRYDRRAVVSFAHATREVSNS